jgi:hypothetical protein
MGAGEPKPGSGQGMQLPDIIKKQEGLGEKMKEGMEKGQKPGDGKEGKAGEGSKKVRGSARQAREKETQSFIRKFTKNKNNSRSIRK